MIVGFDSRAGDSPQLRTAAADARSAVDQLLWQRALRTKGGALAAEVRVVNAQASATLEGVDFPIPAWRSGSAFDGSPMGRVAGGIWRLESALLELETIWKAAPGQALARMHSLLGAGVLRDDQLGRPRLLGSAPADPMHLGQTPPEAERPSPAAALLTLLREYAATVATADGDVPALVLAAVIHAELMWSRPFGFGDGPIARAVARLVLASRGVDPNLLGAADAGLAAAGRPAYVRALRGYLRGDPAGAGEWMIFYCGAVARGAAISEQLLSEL